MGFEQYHEPADELSAETRTFARIIVSLGEEAEAINWYEQRISVEEDAQARAIMEDSQEEEFKHFGMDLEFLLRRKDVWRETLQGILFQPGDIVEHALSRMKDGTYGLSEISGKPIPVERLKALPTATTLVGEEPGR